MQVSVYTVTKSMNFYVFLHSIVDDTEFIHGFFLMNSLK